MSAQRGQAIIVIALMLTVLLGAAALAIDIGNATSDRRMLQAAADSAALAGTRSSAQGTAASHWVALQYLGRQLGFAVPVGSCSSATSCPAGTYTSGAYTVTLQDAGSALDVGIRHAQPTFFAWVLGLTTVTDGASGRAIPETPVSTTLNYALAALNGSAQVNGGGTSSPSGNVAGPVYASSSFGSNNGSHAPIVPTVQYGVEGSQCAGAPANHVDLGGLSDGLSYQWTPTAGTQNTGVSPPIAVGAAPTSGGPRYTSTASAKDVAGHWKPGIYDGIYPSGGLLNPGVFKVVNVSSNLSLGSVANAIPPVTGYVDTAGAVAIVLDSSDTGNLDISGAVLDGIDYLRGQTSGTFDPQGTHNFVIYGQTYQGSVKIGPHSTTNLTGVVYLPNTTVTYDGGASPTFVGSLIVASIGPNGGGNGTQVFDWICGLSTVDGSHHLGGLVR